MAAYRRVDGFKSPAGWLPVHLDQLRAQRLVTVDGVQTRVNASARIMLCYITLITSITLQHITVVVDGWVYAVERWSLLLHRISCRPRGINCFSPHPLRISVRLFHQSNTDIGHLHICRAFSISSNTATFLEMSNEISNCWDVPPWHSGCEHFPSLTLHLYKGDVAFLVMLGRKLRWPRSVLPPGESRWICATRHITVRKKTGETDRRTPDS